jgi:hypothetical protein
MAARRGYEAPANLQKALRSALAPPRRTLLRPFSAKSPAEAKAAPRGPAPNRLCLRAGRSENPPIFFGKLPEAALLRNSATRASWGWGSQRRRRRQAFGAAGRSAKLPGAWELKWGWRATDLRSYAPTLA